MVAKVLPQKIELNQTTQPANFESHETSETPFAETPKAITQNEKQQKRQVMIP